MNELLSQERLRDNEFIFLKYGHVSVYNCQAFCGGTHSPAYNLWCFFESYLHIGLFIYLFSYLLS